MLGALFYHFEWVLALSDISNQVFSLYPYANSLQTGFKTGQTPESRRVCQAESVRQFFPRRRSVDQLPTADSASKYLLSDPSSLLLQQSNLASEHCGGVGACLDCLHSRCSVAGQEVGRGCCCKHHRRWEAAVSQRLSLVAFLQQIGGQARQGTAGRSCCWEWLLGAQRCRLDPSLLHISCLQAGHCKPTRKSEEKWRKSVVC